MRDEKLRALRAAMQWLFDNHRGIVRPFPNWVKTTKRLAEIAWLAQHILDLGVGKLDPMLEKHAEEWLKGAWLLTREAELFVEALEQDHGWATLAMNYTSFRRRGYRNARFEDVVRQAATRMGAVEDWFVKLCLAAAFVELGIESPLDTRALAAESWAARLGDYQRPDPAQAYETTHLVFWLGDLGLIPAELRARLLPWHGRWIDAYVQAQNVDIVAELIASHHYLADECVNPTAWTWLLAKQHADGSFPEMDIPDRALGRFHVTVVSAMALTLCLAKSSCK
jgi:hypothetical protein